MARSMAFARVGWTSIRRSSWAIRSTETDADLVGHRLDRRTRPGLDRHPEPSGEPDSPEEPELVLAEPGFGVADRPQDPGVEVGPAADVVEHLAAQRVEEHPVDREIASLGVEPGVAEPNRLGPPAVDIGPVAPERRDLDLGRGPLAEHTDHAEADPHRDGPPEQAR